MLVQEYWSLNTNFTQNVNVGEQKAIDTLNNRDSSEDFVVVVASGTANIPWAARVTEGLGILYGTYPYPELEKADSAKLTDYKRKKYMKSLSLL